MALSSLWDTVSPSLLQHLRELSFSRAIPSPIAQDRGPKQHRQVTSRHHAEALAGQYRLPQPLRCIAQPGTAGGALLSHWLLRPSHTVGPPESPAHSRTTAHAH